MLNRAFTCGLLLRPRGASFRFLGHVRSSPWWCATSSPWKYSTISGSEMPIADASASRRSTSGRNCARVRARGCSLGVGGVGGDASTNVPTPRCVASTPGRSNSAYTLATVLAFTGRSTASWRTVGSRSPTASRPGAIAARMLRSSCAYIGVGSVGSTENTRNTIVLVQWYNVKAGVGVDVTLMGCRRTTHRGVAEAQRNADGLRVVRTRLARARTIMGTALRKLKQFSCLYHCVSIFKTAFAVGARLAPSESPSGYSTKTARGTRSHRPLRAPAILCASASPRLCGHRLTKLKTKTGRCQPGIAPFSYTAH